ncbi:hypothetical protein [Micromonospora sp. NPDC023737]|uniref:hypothetical protein n=1 Tax=unclassified Micromonospora TaxID=2617518 RepID=UPI0033F3A7AC
MSDNRIRNHRDDAAAWRRRQEAARRLPPMPCGCRDPLERAHREGRCRYRRRGDR